MAPTPPFLAWLIHLLQLPEEMDGVQNRQVEMEIKMANYRDEIDAINAETNALSARVDAVIERANTDDPAVEAELRAISDRLKGMAADPASAEPEPSPEPEQPTEPAPAEPTDPNAPVEGDQPA